MCGIFGWQTFDQALTGSELESSRSAAQTLAHRGPDDQGEWTDNYYFAGHTRLSIIDLSSRASQPFVSDDGRYVLSYNGEIYNYIELRKELVRQGVRFLTESDTEVFLSAFRVWGEDAFKKFDGMFSAAVYDKHTRNLYLIRDHLGQKPLYYYHYGSGIIYASELRALLSIDQFKWEIEKENLSLYLALSYYPWDKSPVKGINKLLPGCFLKIRGKEKQVTRFWDSIPGDDPYDISMGEAVQKAGALIEDSVQKCLRADVPLGIFFFRRY